MPSSALEKLVTDIDSAIVASGSFGDLTIYVIDLDEDEDADYEFSVPNIIYGVDAIPTDYFMDGTRMMSADVAVTVNVSEFDTINSLTRKKCVNYILDLLQDTLDAMTFSTVTPIEFSTTGGQSASKVAVAEDEFVYRGVITMNVQYLDD